MKTYENEIPKYIKKKRSSVSKSKEKSKHKHEYMDCLLIDEDNRPHKATHCKFCGKISDVKFCEIEKTYRGTYRMLDSEEVFEKYKNLPHMYVKDIFQKYVSTGIEE